MCIAQTLALLVSLWGSKLPSGNTPFPPLTHSLGVRGASPPSTEDTRPSPDSGLQWAVPPNSEAQWMWATFLSISVFINKNDV